MAAYGQLPTSFPLSAFRYGCFTSCILGLSPVLLKYMQCKPLRREFYQAMFTSLRNVDIRFIDLAKGNLFLHLVILISQQGGAITRDNILELLCALISGMGRMYTDNPVPGQQAPRRMSIMYLRRAEEYLLMWRNFSDKLETFLVLKIVKRFLKESLVFNDKYSDSVHIISRIYLISVYLITGNFAKCLKYLQSHKSSVESPNFMKIDPKHCLKIKIHLLSFLPRISIFLGLSKIFEYFGCSNPALKGSDQCDIANQIVWLFLIIECNRRNQTHFNHSHIKIILSQYRTDNQHPRKVNPFDMLMLKYIQQTYYRRVYSSGSLNRSAAKMARQSISDLECLYGVPFTFENKLCELLRKYAVVNLTKFHRIMNQSSYLGFFSIASHHIALYWYTKKQYVKCLNVCLHISRWETYSTSDIWSFNIPLAYPFPVLFDDSLAAFLGFLYFCISFASFWDIETNDIVYNRVSMRPEFLVQYLTLGCLVKMRSGRSRICHALEKLRWRLDFERMIHLFICLKTVKRYLTRKHETDSWIYEKESFHCFLIAVLR